jgi:putative polysaccharide biosynthesis protein
MHSDETATSYLHRAHRRMAWARFGRSGKSRVKRFAKRSVAPVYWYVQPILQAVPEVRSRHREVRTEYGVGTIAQLLGCVAFIARFRAFPSSYFEYRLFLRECWPRRTDYLYYDEMWSILSWLNARLAPDDAADLSDKRRFHDRASRAGLPNIPVLAEFNRGAVVQRREWAAHPACDLFSKFADGWHGHGVSLWQRQPDGSYCGDFGSGMSLAELYTRLCALSLEHPLIVQPRLTNHGELQTISGKGLSTVRVVTVRDVHGNIEVALACFRMAVGQLVADNFAAGGLASPVRLEDGRLGPAVFKSRPGVFPVHPDTGAAILGRHLPHWREVMQLAIAGHQEFKALPSIGWDIAITEAGPVIVEGNSEWGTNVVQMSHGKPLEATIVPARLVEHLSQFMEGIGRGTL